MGIGHLTSIEYSGLKQGSAFAQTETGSRPLGEGFDTQVIGLSGEDSKVYYFVPLHELVRTLTEMMKAKTTPNMGILPSEEEFVPGDLREAYRQITECSAEQLTE